MDSIKNKNKVKISASILSADFSCLAEQMQEVEEAGVDMFHIDVMDGHFVPNITMGPVVLKSIRKITKLPLEAHLMIENPKYFIEDFIKAGADLISIHIETISASNFKKIGLDLKNKRVSVGVSLNPDTPLDRIIPLFNYVDFILVMTVYPGFSGQNFMYKVLPKIEKLRSIFKKDIIVDGGINDKTAPLVIKAGANILCSASYLFSAKNKKLAIRRLRNG